MIFLAWHYDKKGVFSVKSAYHVLDDIDTRENRTQQGESSSGTGRHGCEWNAIWKLKCLPKVRQFLWRLAHNSLPWRMNIKRRGIKDIDTRCPMCGRLDEDGGHLFLKCKMVKQCWVALNLEQVWLKLILAVSAKDMVRDILAMDEAVQRTVIMFLWCWWDARNKANAGEKMQSTDEVVFRTIRYAAETEMMQVKEVKHGHKTKECWTKPQAEMLKVNFDGGFVAQEKRDPGGLWCETRMAKQF